jgi:translation initiation factor IF-1
MAANINGNFVKGNIQHKKRRNQKEIYADFCSDTDVYAKVIKKEGGKQMRVQLLGEKKHAIATLRGIHHKKMWLNPDDLIIIRKNGNLMEIWGKVPDQYARDIQKLFDSEEITESNNFSGDFCEICDDLNDLDDSDDLNNMNDIDEFSEFDNFDENNKLSKLNKSNKPNKSNKTNKFNNYDNNPNANFNNKKITNINYNYENMFLNFPKTESESELESEVESEVENDITNDKDL